MCVHPDSFAYYSFLFSSFCAVTVYAIDQKNGGANEKDGRVIKSVGDGWQGWRRIIVLRLKYAISQP